MSKKNRLEVGQLVWIEATQMFFRIKREDDRKVDEYQIIESNNSSAYAVSVDDLVRYNKDPKSHSYLRRRIQQNNHNVIGNGFGDNYDLWLTKESFEANVKYNKDWSVARKKAEEIVSGMTLDELKSLIKEYK